MHTHAHHRGLIRVALSILAAFTMMLWSMSGAAAAVEFRETIPIEGFVFTDICGQELVHTSGSLHLVATFTINNNRVSGTLHGNPQGAKLIDGSGQEWVGTGVFQSNFSEPLENGAATFLSLDSFKIIGKGGATSFLVQRTISTTINANGEMTSSVENVSVRCR
ncbi:MAG: hypothetical protein OES24_07150 [Acidimicrobiia bacterium]|nr:hypothetical protein [Acidimicrobiia bacterium]